MFLPGFDVSIKPGAGQSNGVTWSGWSLISNEQTFDAPTSTTYAGKLHVTVRGTDDRVWDKTYDGVTWSGWSLISPESIFSAPTTAVYNNQLHLTARGTDNRVWDKTGSSI